MEELIKALSVDFEGYEVLRQQLLHLPKYGNDKKEVDALAKQIADHFLARVNAFRGPENTLLYPGLYNIDFKIFANVTGATPDGRRFRDAIAEHCSPTPGAAKKGPTAILNSASTLPMKEGFASSVLHLTLDKNGYSMGADRIKIIDTLLRASEKKKIPVLSITMYDKAELLDAQLHPEKHQDLIVRVWGFQARFTELDKELQDHIINRISSQEWRQRVEQTAMVMDIQRFSIHDGPGIRTTVFLKGCHMSCLWCHNPESQYAKPQLMFYEAQCIGCGRCVKKCIRYTFKKKTRPNTQNHVLYEPDLKICRDCEQMRSCAENCPSEALRLCGRTMTVQEVMTEIEKDVDCYIDGGGVTFSGGEPLLQSAFLKEILPKCAEKKISVCLDTTLEVMWEKIEPLLPYVGLFLVDVKILNPEKASVYQGICYKNMPKNLKRLSDLNIPVIIRVPLAKGINDTPEEIERRETLLKSLTNIIRIDSFYVSNHGASKYKALQKEMMWKASVADEKSDQLDIGGIK